MSLPSSSSRFSARRDHSITSSTTKAVDVGKPLGVYDSNSVRDRVRQWQAQGGGVVMADDIGMKDNQVLERLATKCRTPKRQPTPTTPSFTERGNHEHITPSKSHRNSTKPNVEKRDSNRSGSAPAKRVVSDGHWRKKRSPPKTIASSKITKDTASASTTLDEGIRVNAPPELKIIERTKRRESTKTPKKESCGGDGGFRNYMTPPGSRRHSKKHQRRQSELSDSGKLVMSDIEPTRISPASETAGQGNRSIPEAPMQISSSGAKDESRRHSSNSQRAEHPDEALRSAGRASSDIRGSVRTQKGNILSHVFSDSRTAFVKESPEPIATPRIPSIEAWLNETPDPFLDADDPPLEVIPPLNPSTNKRRVKTEEEVRGDCNRVWEALDTKKGVGRAVHRSKGRHRIPSSAIY